jgi:hypothetical protein
MAVKRLELVPPVEPDEAVMPSRQLADGSIVYGLFEDRPPPYLTVLPAGRGEGVQDPDGSGGDG